MYLNKQSYVPRIIFIIANVSIYISIIAMHIAELGINGTFVSRSTCTRALNEAIYAQTEITNILETPRIIPSPWNRRITLASALGPLKL